MDCIAADFTETRVKVEVNNNSMEQVNENFAGQLDSCDCSGSQLDSSSLDKAIEELEKEIHCLEVKPCSTSIVEMCNRIYPSLVDIKHESIDNCNLEGDSLAMVTDDTPINTTTPKLRKKSSLLSFKRKNYWRRKPMWESTRKSSNVDSTKTASPSRIETSISTITSPANTPPAKDSVELVGLHFFIYVFRI